VRCSEDGFYFVGPHARPDENRVLLIDQSAKHETLLLDHKKENRHDDDEGK
jgi:hypothetical protein